MQLLTIISVTVYQEILLKYWQGMLISIFTIKGEDMRKSIQAKPQEGRFAYKATPRSTVRVVTVQIKRRSRP